VFTNKRDMKTDRTYGGQFYSGSPARLLSIFDIFEFEEIEGNHRASCTPDFEIDLHCDWLYQRMMSEPVLLDPDKDVDPNCAWGVYICIRYNGKEIDIRINDDAYNHLEFFDFIDHVVEAYISFPEDHPKVIYGNDYFDGLITDGHARSVFRGANQFITSDILVERTHVKFLVRNTPDLSYEDYWFIDRMTPLDFFTEYDQKSLEELKQPMLLAVSMRHGLFLSTVYHAVLRMIKAIGFDGYKESFSQEFPHRLLRKLELVVMLYTAETDGYYERDNSIYEGAWPPDWNRETLTIPSRRIRTIEELEKAGILCQ